MLKILAKLFKKILSESKNEIEIIEDNGISMEFLLSKNYPGIKPLNSITLPISLNAERRNWTTIFNLKVDDLALCNLNNNNKTIILSYVEFYNGIYIYKYGNYSTYQHVYSDQSPDEIWNRIEQRIKEFKDKEFNEMKIKLDIEKEIEVNIVK